MALYPVYYSDSNECTNTRDSTTGVCSQVSQCNANQDTCPGYRLARDGRSGSDKYQNVFGASDSTQQFAWSMPTIAPTPMPTPEGIGGKDWWIGGFSVFIFCFGGFAGFVMYMAKVNFDKELEEEMAGHGGHHG